MSDQAPPPPRTKCSCGCGAPLRDIDGRPLDQAPATDPALDALDRVEEAMQHHAGTFHDSALALIREALADRITPAEARMIDRWASIVEDMQGHGAEDDAANALLVRLRRIADQETGR